MKKNQKGITLIALVITIIVLLILAGVTIATLTGDNGLLQKATNAKEENEKAVALEKIKVEVAGSYGLDGKIDIVELNKNLLKINGLKYKKAPLSEENSIKLPAIVELYNNSYHITNNGTVTYIKPQAIGNLTKDNYGDYLDLGQSVVGTSSTADDWRILYNDKINHKIYVILADYLPNSTNIASEAGLNQIEGSLYNVNTLDDNRNTLLNGFKSPKWKQRLVADYLKENSKIEVNGAVTAEIIMASYNEKHNTNLNYIDKPHLYEDLSDTNKGIDMLYQPRAGNEPFNGSRGYWLNTPEKTVNGKNIWFISFAGTTTDVYCIDTIGSICPVVIIDDDFLVTDTISNGKTIWSLVE